MFYGSKNLISMAETILASITIFLIIIILLVILLLLVQGVVKIIIGITQTQVMVRLEYIVMKSGKERAVRTFDAATSEYSYTTLGKRFYKDIRKDYIVKVPAKFVGTRGQAKTINLHYFRSSN